MSNSSVKKLSYNVPLWHKPNLSIEEASIYSNIGTGKLYEMTEKQDCPFVLWIVQSADSNRLFCGAKRTRCGASGLNL